MPDLFEQPTTTIRPPLDGLDQLVTPLTAGEDRVVRALSALEPGWSVYVKPRVGLDRTDFLALHATYGVCVIEVVDWRSGATRRNDDGDIELLGADGQWAPTIDPRFVASRSRSTLFDQFYALPEHGGVPTDAIRAIVIVAGFSTSDARAMLSALPEDDPQSLVSVYGDDAVAASMREIVVGHVGQAENPGFVPPTAAMTKLRRHIVASERLPVEHETVWMSEGVRDVALNRSGLKTRRVRGAAGSGKSFAVTARAARLAAEGKSVLILTLNVTLANRLRALANDRCREVGANPTLIACSNFHTFCTRVVQDAEMSGLQLAAPRGASWVLGIVSKTQQAFDQGFGVAYDAILVDEGQDFTAEWWNLLRTHVLAPGGEMLVVADPTQDIYERFEWTTDENDDGPVFVDGWFDLETSYRLPNDLLDLTNDFASQHLEGEQMHGSEPGHEIEVPGGPSGSVRNWLDIERLNQLGRAVGHEVVRLLRESPTLQPADVAFVCDYHHDGVAAVRVIEQAGYPVHHIFSRDPDAPRRRRKHRFWPEADAVKGCTAHSLKGWESPAVVMGIGTDDRAQRLAYVAMTRVAVRPEGGPSFISIVNADTRLAEFGRRFVAGSQPVPEAIPAHAAAAAPQPPETPLVAPDASAMADLPAFDFTPTTFLSVPAAEPATADVAPSPAAPIPAAAPVAAPEPAVDPVGAAPVALLPPPPPPVSEVIDLPAPPPFGAPPPPPFSAPAAPAPVAAPDQVVSIH